MRHTIIKKHIDIELSKDFILTTIRLLCDIRHSQNTNKAKLGQEKLVALEQHIKTLLMIN
jgi:hypothetical protein